MEELTPRSLTDEEEYYYEQSWKEPVEGIARIEEMAKFLVGSAAGTSGLFLAASKLSLGSKPVSESVWFIPFVFWGLSIVAFIFVLLPRIYPHGRNEPAAIKAAFIKARKEKYYFLITGTFLFIAGILTGFGPFLD
ncbi:MAG: hypothetical protein GY737_22300 [Desulfobacteraceae bacterium]|nr:hypothetical protein [Desulfobacteraceae bacterium]